VTPIVRRSVVSLFAGIGGMDCTEIDDQHHRPQLRQFALPLRM
jgi:hypothetical protein